MSKRRIKKFVLCIYIDGRPRWVVARPNYNVCLSEKSRTSTEKYKKIIFPKIEKILDRCGA